MYLLLLCVNDVWSVGPTIVFIVCHSVLSSQPINVHTFILRLSAAIGGGLSPPPVTHINKQQQQNKQKQPPPMTIEEDSTAQT